MVIEKARGHKIRIGAAALSLAVLVTGTVTGVNKGNTALAKEGGIEAVPAGESLAELSKAPGLTKAAAGSEINGHKWIAESTDYNLYMDEADLSLVVEDKVTGSYMESSISYDDGMSNNTWLGAMKSALVLTVIKGNDDTKQADLVNDNVTKKITYTDMGFTADVSFDTYGFEMRLEVALTEDGLIARIPDDSIVEKNTDYQIGTICMYPFMGNSYLDDKEGYMLIPDGNGALIYLNDKEGAFSSGYASPIYGSDVGFEESQVITLLWDRYEMVTDAEQVIAPVYGIAHTDDEIAYLAVVEDGATRANIEAYPNGTNVNYNRAQAKFIERKLYTQPTSNNSTAGSFHMVEADRTHSDLSVRFMFLTGDRANYAGMAEAYRNYLIDKGELTKLDTSYRTRVDFLGTERESWLLGTKAVVMTKVNDAEEITNDLASQGVGSLLSVYKGWQAGGLYNLPISKYSTEGQIGGNSAMTRFIKNSEDKGNLVYLYDEALRINPSEHNATFNVVKQINKRNYYEETYMDVYEQFMYQTPDRSAELLTKTVDSYVKDGADNIAVGGITNNIFSYSYGGQNHDRAYTADKFESVLDAVNEKTQLVLEQPFAYLWHDTDAFLDMPMYTSSYMLEDVSVPFLSLVLKGVMPVYSEYINFEANKREFFLKLIETGTYPSFYITKESSATLIYTNSNNIYSSEYDAYKDTIVQYDKELREFNSKVDGALITGHDMLGDVTIVTYDNGVKVYVNYSSEDLAVDGVSIDAMSYEVVG